MRRIMARHKVSDLKITDNTFFIEVDNKHKAYITYSKRGDHYTLDHCEVPSSLRGRGIGKEVVTKTFDYLRPKNVDVTIHCSYIRNIVDRFNLQDPLDYRNKVHS